MASSVEGGVQSVVAALDVLDCFAEDDELGVSEIARRLGVAKSTAHRLLTSLCSRGMTERNPESGQYRLGMHLFELGQLAQDRMRLRQAARPLLEHLRQVSGSTCHMTIPLGSTGDVLFVERLDTLDSLRIIGEVGTRWPAHATSSGKAISAFNPQVAAARRLAGFPALTPRTIGCVEEFDEALVAIRQRGYATNNGEARTGASSIAAPVLDAQGQARAAVSLSGTDEEIARNAQRHAQLVTTAARRLAELLERGPSSAQS